MKISQKLKSMSGVWLVVLSVGIALGGFFIGDGIYRAMSGRTVTVKGLAERDVVADTAVWNIKINGVGGDLAELQQRIDNDITEINMFLIEAGFAPDDIQNLRVQSQFFHKLQIDCHYKEMGEEIRDTLMQN